MNIEMWPIDRPKDYPRNARKWSAQAISKVGASIREYGWRQPVVVDSKEVIVIGHLRRAAGKNIGETQCPVHVAADLTPEQIRGLRLADNRTNQESVWDLDLLGVEFLEL
ncbi:MAG TPA: ParB N-terminal domain-containing protein, partial [Bryobacteraceae bacterium]|nr:ParB N-terminal domain-containing protein [Bryobacteraceae bacterium]